MDIEAIEDLLRNVTPGPWHIDGEVWNQVVWSDAENRVCFMAHSNGLDDERDVATARFIAAARDGWPETIAALKAVIAERDAMQFERDIARAEIKRWENAFSRRVPAAEAEAATLRVQLDATRADRAQIIAERDNLSERLQSAMMDGHDLAKNEYRDIIARLEARVKELASALLPFTAWASFLPHDAPDSRRVAAHGGRVTYGDLRRARTLLTKAKEADHG